MHDISPSYLSRCVRKGKSAKGHDLCPYVLFEETGDEKKVFGFAFPPGYEPADSAVDGNERARPQGKSENGRVTGAVRQKEESHCTEEVYQGPTTNGSLPEDSPDEVSRVQEDIDDLKDDVGELESVITEVANALGQIAQELAESRERQERIERAVEDFTGGVEALRDEREEQFWKLHKWLSDQFLQLGKSRRENAKIVDKQFEHLDDRISGLREWVEIVVDGAQEDLERSREQALQELSTDLQEEIRDPILDVLADEDEGEDLWANGIGFAAVLAVIEILDKRPDLVVQGVRALGGGNETGETPLSPPPADEEAQKNSRSESG
jgi:archaellum component FlaC